ncbi:hypothetical protein EJ04DRAFT_547643 [Polyplosphaeria fusca]|uniref:Zn(2)-C6 fungal-type domain-containing protein n=1 Tax=Polyplosphaeria fusca TaxID=682080 RepID=A0A9P4V9B6_9PLEO|nr:hypothetical protein EJ04DRAFT_547643 [Polyplosphaeria fusca]
MAEQEPVLKRHCWTCIKRRTVCDFTRPKCKKCQKAGVECAGYSEKKPLEWLEPGRVSSRQRTKRPSPKPLAGKGQRARSKKSADKDNEALGFASLEISKKRSEHIWNERMKMWGECMNSLEAPSPSYLRDETTEIVQATEFYNNRIYPVMSRYSLMAQAPYMQPFPMLVLHQLPPTISHSFVGITLGWRFHRQELPTDDIWPKVYHHRGAMIRDVAEKVSRCDETLEPTTQQQKSTFDVAIVCLLVFATMEIQYMYSTSVNWRQHMDAMGRLISIRGGITSLWHETQLVRGALTFFVGINTFSGSSSPASTLAFAEEHPDLPDLPEDLYEGIFCYSLCPTPLFRHIASINLLRARIARGTMDVATGKIEALRLLMRIDAFSTQQWMEMRETKYPKEFTLIGTVFQAAAVIYCILSLQCLGTLEETQEIRDMRGMYTDLLFDGIEQGLADPLTRFFMLWPNIVAGVIAGKHRPGTQIWISDTLASLGREHGQSMSILAKAALGKFWASGKTTWEDCFTVPYALSC